MPRREVTAVSSVFVSAAVSLMPPVDFDARAVRGAGPLLSRRAAVRSVSTASAIRPNASAVARFTVTDAVAAWAEERGSSTAETAIAVRVEHRLNVFDLTEDSPYTRSDAGEGIFTRPPQLW